MTFRNRTISCARFLFKTVDIEIAARIAVFAAKWPADQLHHRKHSAHRAVCPDIALPVKYTRHGWTEVQADRTSNKINDALFIIIQEL